MPLSFLQNLIMALLLGALIGIERERHHKDEDLHEFGVRTMALTSLFGFLVYTLFSGDLLLFAIFNAGFLALVVASYVVSSFITKRIGATTEISAFFVYLIGVMMAMGEVLYASTITLLVVLLLYFKETLHRFAHGVQKEEFYDTLKFIVIAFIVLPLLPNEVVGPMDVLNPYNIWFIVVLISSISFISYIAIKALGAKKGIGLSGFLGGLISSTATSMSFSQMSKKAKSLVNPFVFGVLIASSAMFFRVLVEVSVLNPSLLEKLYIPMVSMGVTGLFLSFIFWLNKGKKKTNMKEDDLKLKSPFQLWPAIQFGALFAALLFVSKLVSTSFGSTGVYLTAFISGLVDVDAITVSMANLNASGDLSSHVALTAITIAAMTNTLVKGGIVLSFASRKVGVRTFLSMLCILGAGGVSLLFI